jgi:uncharacterized protein YdbL (DUF1318 family)
MNAKRKWLAGLAPGLAVLALPLGLAGGCLEALAALAPADAKTVAEENADRQAVYAAIAAKNGAAAEAVAQQRAETIARTAPAGTMVQAPDGKWTEKK